MSFQSMRPGKPFVWKSIAVGEGDGAETRAYACSKEGSTDGIVLTMVRRSADTEATKAATLKTHFNAMLQTLHNAGFTDIRGPQLCSRAPRSRRASSPRGP